MNILFVISNVNGETFGTSISERYANKKNNIKSI